MEYLLKSTICLSAFYGLYFFGFRRMSFHALNRSYLLVSLALSLTIPLLSYERTEVVVLEPQAIEVVNIPVEELQESAINQSTTIQPTKSIEKIPVKTIDWLQILNAIYLLGVEVMIFVFLKNLLIILYTIKKASNSMASVTSSVAERIRSHSSSNRKLKILLTRSQSNSSFFNYIFLNPDNLNPHEKTLIIAHEGFHAQRLHTLDLLILGILKAVFWFNPIVYFYQKSLKQIHEYEVDALMSASYDGREYAHLLLKLGVAPNAMIINQFSTKPLSERFQFLFKTPTKNMKKLFYFLSLPIIAVGVMAFAEEKVVRVYQEKEGIKPIQLVKVNQYISKIDTLKKEKIVLDSLTQSIVSQIDSSKFCRPINFAFNLEKTDSITITSEGQTLIKNKDFIIRDKYIYLEKKYEHTKVAIRVHSSYNIGGPGSYYLYPNLTKLEENTYPIFNKIKAMPIFTANQRNTIAQFKSKLPKLPTPFSKVAKNQDTLRTILEANKLGKNPLVIINRVEYPSSILYRINPEAIESQEISSQKDKNTILFYGDKAKDGCIEIITKKGVDIFLKDNEKRKTVLESVAKQVQESKKRVKREIVKDKNGEEYEKISLMRLDGETVHFSSGIPVGEKTVFIVDGKKVTEEEVENGKQVFVKGGCGIVNKNFLDIYGEAYKNYYSYFILDTSH